MIKSRHSFQTVEQYTITITPENTPIELHVQATIDFTDLGCGELIIDDLSIDTVDGGPDFPSARFDKMVEEAITDEFISQMEQDQRQYSNEDGREDR